MQEKRIYKLLRYIVSLTIVTAFATSMYAVPFSSIGLIQKQDTTQKASIDTLSTPKLDTLSTTKLDTLSTLVMPDSLSLKKLVEYTIQGETELVESMYDSLYFASDSTLAPLDSLKLKELAFPPVVLTKKELKKLEREAIWAHKDSIIRNTPRVLDTYFFPDSTIYRRMFMWRAGTDFNAPTEIKPDTTFNSNYTELPTQRGDVGATSLGVSGSAMQYYNYSKREEHELFPFFTPYLPYTYTPKTMPFYNVKTPYTELGYWGTLFANKLKEETNIKFLHTQNFTPSFNFSILYQRYGGNGILANEKTDNRTFAITGNYLGKRYVAQGGYIFSRVKRDENGGITEPSLVLDTLIDSRTIPVALSNANTQVKKNTFFITHSYSIPFKFMQKKDSLGVRDSLDIDKVTTAYIGHTGEFTTYSKSYHDNISLTDSIGRALYNNNFFINPTTSADSARILQLENKFFLRLQPWANDAIVSKLDIGAGYQYLSYYGFNPAYFLEGNQSNSQNNMYLYFGANGNLKKYFSWSGLGKYNFAGYSRNDLSVDGNVRFSVYPVKDGIHLDGKLHISNKRPNYFFNNYYSNHYIWENDFKNTTTTKIEAKLSIPHYKVEAQVGYTLLNNNVYLDTLAMATQNVEAMSILSASLRKDFKIGILHLNNQALFQVSSNQDVIPLPQLALNLRYFIEITAVKDVLKIQLGANATFNTKYYAPAYSPALGMFYNQTDEQIGNNPYIDAFVNLQWKRASIFVKYVNVAQGWPTSDYFSAYRYLQPEGALKFGIHWPFYLK